MSSFFCAMHGNPRHFAQERLQDVPARNLRFTNLQHFRARQALWKNQRSQPHPRFKVLGAAAVAAEPDIMRVVEVSLGDRSYPIYIGRDLLGQGELLRRHIPGKRVLIITNETIAPLYLER
jgi:hypothetical protein